MSEEKLVEMEKKLTPQERERLEIQQQRESLPMYEYRDDLLKAIRDHQVTLGFGLIHTSTGWSRSGRSRPGTI